MKIRTDSLRAERTLSGLTRLELADRAEISLATAKRAEYGKPVSAPVIRKLADALGCTVADIAEPESDAEATALARQAEAV